MIVEWLKALVYGVVEGITEWLPISSTGHLILFEKYLPFLFSSDETFLKEFWEMFEVVIQLGAILAVIILFWKELYPLSKKHSKAENKSIWSMWWKIVVACIPAGVVGVIGDKLLEKVSGKDINGWLYSATVVAVALIVYGVAFIVIEKMQKGKTAKVDSLDEITYRTAFFIGIFQALSIIPGTSRSGSTILGSMILGLSRTVAAKFSFFMAIPIMIGASGIKVLGFAKYMLGTHTSMPFDGWMTLLIGCAVSFLVSLFAIRFLMDFVKRHSFTAFGYYRIALGAVVLLNFFFS